jgi:hypothetical protein
MRRFIPSIALNLLVPLLAYVLLKPHMTDLVALAISSALPLVFTVVEFLWHKRIDPIGVIAIVGYVVVLTISLLSGGSPLVLKLNETVITGPVGLLFLGSLAVGKPLHLVIHQIIARRKGVEVSERTRRGSVVITGVIGAMLTIHALVTLFLALSLSTGSFLALSRPVGWSIIGVGAAAILWYRRRLQAS